MDVPYFIKEHLSISASNEATLKKYFVEVNPRQSWPWKQNGTKDFKKKGFNPCKAEQPLQGMESQEKKHKNIKAYTKSFYKEAKVNRCMLILDFRS